MMVAEPVRVPVSFRGFGAVSQAAREDLAAPYIDVLNAVHLVHQRTLVAKGRPLVTKRLRLRLQGILDNLLSIENDATQPTPTFSAAELHERVRMNDRDLRAVENEIRRNIILVSLGSIAAAGAAGYYVYKRG